MALTEASNLSAKSKGDGIMCTVLSIVQKCQAVKSLHAKNNITCFCLCVDQDYSAQSKEFINFCTCIYLDVHDKAFQSLVGGHCSSYLVICVLKPEKKLSQQKTFKLDGN